MQVLWADSGELVYVCDVCRCCGLTVVSWYMCVLMLWADSSELVYVCDGVQVLWADSSELVYV